MLKDNLIKIPKNLNFNKFDNEFVWDVNAFMNQRTKHYSTVAFDLTGTVWMDLMEAACLNVAAEWIAKTTNCLPEFSFRLPLRSGKAANIKGAEIRKTNAFYFHFLTWWRILEVLHGIGFAAKGMLEEGEFIDYGQIENLLNREDSEVEPKYRQYITWLKQEWMKLSYIEERGGSLRLLPFTEVSDKNRIHESVGKLKKRLEQVKWLDEEGRGILCDTIIFELCKNIVDHAYDQHEPQPKTAILAVRLLHDPTGEGEVVTKNIDPRRVKELIKYRINNAPERYKDFFIKNRYSGFLEIVVVDGGCGIPKSLHKNYFEKKQQEGKETEIIEYAFEEGTTRRDKQTTPTAGRSLALVKENIQYWGVSDTKDFPGSFGGLLEIRSMHGRVTYSPGADPIIRDDLPELPGVQYRIFLPIRTQESQAKRKSAIDNLLELEKRQYRLFDTSAE